MLMLTRYSGNPIITPRVSDKWYPLKAYNPTVIKVDDRYVMYFRGVGPDWISRLMSAESHDGYHFKVGPDPVIIPDAPWEAGGCEDPRLVRVGGHYCLTYTAFDGATARAAMASSTDLRHWEGRHLLFPELEHYQRENLPKDWSKAAAIIPEAIDGWYYLLFGDNHIWPARSRDLYFWEPSLDPILMNRPGHFDAAYIEMGPSPIRTNRGWLVIYHGIDELTQDRTYAIGAALLDLNDPRKVVWRCEQPIMVPTETYETIGFIDLVPGGYRALRSMSLDDIRHLHNGHKLPTAIFCCGAILEGNDLRLYYGAADTCIATATVDLDTILDS